MNRSKTIGALAITALLAGGGTATAGKMITGKDIRNGSVTEVDLDAHVRTKLANTGKPGPQGERGVTGATGIQGPKGSKGESGNDGKDGEDGAKGQDGQDGLRGPQGLTGDKGDQGNRGLTGSPGQDGASGQVIASFPANGSVWVLENSGTHDLSVTCPDNKVPTGGGYRIEEGTAQVTRSYPTNEGWSVTFATVGGPTNVSVYVICITNQ